MGHVSRISRYGSKQDHPNSVESSERYVTTRWPYRVIWCGVTALLALADRDELILAADGLETRTDSKQVADAMKTCRLNDACCVGVAGESEVRRSFVAWLLERPDLLHNNNAFRDWEREGARLDGDVLSIRDDIADWFRGHPQTPSARVSVLLVGRDGEEWREILWNRKHDRMPRDEVTGPDKKALTLGFLPAMRTGSDIGFESMLISGSGSPRQRVVEVLRLAAKSQKSPLINANILIRSSSTDSIPQWEWP